MAGRKDRSDEVAFPALLRAARTAYASAIREALAKAGCDDLPRNGSYVISAIARSGAPFSRIIEALGVSKQASGQLIDTLVLRGYLDRSVDPEDRRRLTVALTEQGRLAARACRSAVERIDAELAKTVDPEYIAHTRVTLAALIQTSRGAKGRDHGE